MSRVDPLVPPAGAVLLRQVPGRATWLEPAGERGAARVVKVWRARELLRRLGDGRRARREARRLRRAAAVGLPVPTLLACARRGGAWRIEMSVLEARSLDVWLAGNGYVATGVSLARAGAATAALVARLQRLGARLGDGHLGNFLVDARGRAFAVDFGHTHLPAGRGRFRPARVAPELARLVGEALDRAPRRALLAAAAAWWRALEHSERASIGERRAYFARIEQDARLDRRWRVERGNDRWWRPSDHIVQAGDGALARRRLDATVAAALIARARAGGVASGDLERTAAATFVAYAATSHAERRALERLWHAAGRLADHQVPAARPAVLVQEPNAVAWLELPAGAAPCPPSGARHDAAHRAAAERLLRVAPPPPPLAPLWCAGDDAWLLAGDVAHR